MLDVNGEITNAVMWALGLAGLPHPGGDPAEIQRHAKAYEQQAQALRTAYAEMGSAVRGATWSGPAADAQAMAWEQHSRTAHATAEGLSTVAKHLDDHAVKTAKVLRTIIGIALEIIEQYLMCLALSWVTARLADFVFLSRVGPLVTRLAQWWAEFRKLVISAMESMKVWGRSAGKAGRYLGEFIVDDIPAYAREFPFFVTATVASQGMSGRPVDVGEAALWSVPGFAIDAAMYRGIGVLERELPALARFKSFVEGTRPAELRDEARTFSRLVDFPEYRAAPGSTALNTADEFVLVPLGQSADAIGPTAPQVARYVPKTTREATYSVLKEAFVNWFVVLAGNAMTGVTDGKTLVVDSFVSAPLSGLRKGLFDRLPHGERWAYRNMPEGAPLLLRELPRQLQVTMSYMIRNDIRSPLWDLAHGDEIPTQLGQGDPEQQATAS